MRYAHNFEQIKKVRALFNCTLR